MNAAMDATTQAFPGAPVDLPPWGQAFLVIAASLTIVFALVRLVRNRRR